MVSSLRINIGRQEDFPPTKGSHLRQTQSSRTVWSPTKKNGKSTALRSSQNESFESKFMDENGAVDDMDGYLNYLSLEYDSVWDTKPSWCQPWTIVLTGVLAIAGSWVILQSVVITGIILSLISTWWYVFLYAYPKSYTDMIAERRKNVTSGIEDTFGVKRRQ
ncbi:hypothetical protein Sjap_007914 [Stephania japonica]|uniref:DUF6737 domain-containing protein n=1 Tax=Stephania japonica TaxID=461633 RepID=A0AAP0PE41_9MAGN